MRDDSVRGGVVNKPSQTATTSATDVVAVTLIVPKGCVAIVSGTGLLAPSSNTLDGGLWVDGVQSQAISTNLQTTLAFNKQIPSGSHRIAMRLSGSTATGFMLHSSISWVIVRKDVPV
jgi:hypothetical protein